VKKYIPILVLSMLLSASLLFQLQQTIEAKKPTPPAPQIEFYQVVVQQNLGPNAGVSFTLSCDSGDQVIGGGYALGSGLDMMVIRNEPDNTLSNWEIQVKNNKLDQSDTVRGRVNCLKVKQ